MILMIDDEERWVTGYREALEYEGYTVELISRTDDLSDCLLRENLSKYELVILDIMMAAGKKYENEDVDEGMRTGEFVLMEIRFVWPDIPVIILTNKNRQSDEPQIYESCSGYYKKEETYPSQLVAVIKRLIGGP